MSDQEKVAAVKSMGVPYVIELTSRGERSYPWLEQIHLFSLNCQNTDRRTAAATGSGLKAGNGLLRFVGTRKIGIVAPKPGKCRLRWARKRTR